MQVSFYTCVVAELCLKCSSWLGFCKTGFRYIFNVVDLALHDLFANGVCKLSVHVHVYKLCFAILNDQLGVANSANIFDSAHLVCICLF